MAIKPKITSLVDKPQIDAVVDLVSSHAWAISPARLAEALTPGYERYKHIQLIDNIITEAILKACA